MCGIAGVLNLEPGLPPGEQHLRQMLAMIRHRGPDEFGIYLDGHIGLGSARLSIIDLSSGQQPITNEDGTLWIVFNGEIFNYVDLRPELEAKGHRFSTQSDTEVLLHLYEEYGPRCLERLNGQFAIAIWNTRTQSLFLARDRLGVRPLFYASTNGSLVFGSEIKAILTDPRVNADIDPVTLDQIFTFWSPLSPRTIFRGIAELPPGHYMVAEGGTITVERYWALDFLSLEERAVAKPRTEHDYLEEFESLLVDAARIRLRADVPVGAYLSGGLDSSTIAAIIRNFTNNRLDTFSIAFDDAGFDESQYQRQMAAFLGTDHQVINTTHADIGRVFPEVIWHTETPIMRTSPAPMFQLSGLVRDCGYKVVLTGEGADEFLAGYDIFKEAKVRRFWARQPASTWRPKLLRRLYPDINWTGSGSPAFLAEFFRGGLTELENPAYSHAVRWRNNRRCCRFFSEGLRADLAGRPGGAISAVDYPSRFRSWGPLEQAQFIEATIFMSQYLLCSQGDRVAMAHSVEGRFPFLDCRLVDFSARLPSTLKLRVLTEKFILKTLGRKWLPEEILRRPKRPYRAPIQRSFFNEAAQDYVPELLSPESLGKTGLFSAAAVGQLLRRVHDGRGLGESDEMALVGILSTQLVHRQFVEKFERRPPLGPGDRVKVVVA
jgi:asparagine synthase (glutamine-hydrolysing)